MWKETNRTYAGGSSEIYNLTNIVTILPIMPKDNYASLGIIYFQKAHNVFSCDELLLYKTHMISILIYTTAVTLCPQFVFSLTIALASQNEIVCLNSVSHAPILPQIRSFLQ